MELYNNLLPITFGQKGIPAQNVSFKTGFGNDFQGKIWRLEAGGVVYKVPIHQTLEGQVEYLSPDSIPNLTKKIVLECLEVHLSPNGSVKHKEEDHFDFFPDQDSEAWPNYQEVYFRLEVSYLPEMKHKFMLAISAYNASGKTLSGSENFRKVKSFTSRLSKQTIECKGGPTFTLASPFGESFLAAKQLHKPNLLFRPNGMPVNKSAAQGIAEFGPYSSDKFRKTTLRILVIGRKSNRGSMMNFLGDLKGGMPLTHQGANYPWPEGWAKQYNFADAIWEKHFVASYSREEIEAEVRSVMEKSRGLEVKYDLAFFEADPHAPDVSPENDAFCHLKAHLLKYGIASQAISTETLRLPEYARAEALQEIALNAYAKAGGTPWRILVNQDLEHELVVGIGTTSLNKALYGFSTFFSSEGEYLLGQSSIQGSVAKWEMDLEKLIVSQIKRIEKKDNWQSTVGVRIIFHLSQKMDEEAFCKLKDALHKAFGKYDLSLSFLLFEAEHNFRIWDRKQRGLPGKGGVYQVKRGTYLKISGDLALLQFFKLADHPVISAPYALRLLPGSDISDLDHLAQQAFNFSAMSWRSLQHCKLPVTLEYGNAITTLLEKFRQSSYQKMIVDALLEHPHKTWFL